MNTSDVPRGGRREGAGKKPQFGKTALDELYPLRCFHAERVEWERAARYDGKTLAEWLRDVANQAAKKR